MSIVQNIKKFAFARAEWKNEGAAYDAPPGTWTKPMMGMPKDWLAVVCCPNCHKPGAISTRNNKVDYRGNADRDYECPHCTFVAKVHLSKWGEETLYCVAYHGKPGLLYMHANNEEECRRNFRASGRGISKIIAIGPVIGYYGTEKNDRDLTV